MKARVNAMEVRSTREQTARAAGEGSGSIGQIPKPMEIPVAGPVRCVAPEGPRDPIQILGTMRRKEGRTPNLPAFPRCRVSMENRRGLNGMCTFWGGGKKNKIGLKI